MNQKLPLWRKNDKYEVCPCLRNYTTSFFFIFNYKKQDCNAVRFYLLEVSNQVANFLGDLQQAANETGIDLDVVEWGLDENLKDWTVLWDYGALLALTDCVYKSMKDHGLAYIVDLDEFIVPQVTGLGRNFAQERIVISKKSCNCYIPSLLSKQKTMQWYICEGQDVYPHP